MLFYRRRRGPALKTVTASVLLLLLGSKCREGWDAFVWCGGGHEARQTVALVRALHVGARPVLTQGHLVADVLTFVDVCREKRETRHSVSRLRE